MMTDALVEQSADGDVGGTLAGAVGVVNPKTLQKQGVLPTRMVKPCSTGALSGGGGAAVRREAGREGTDPRLSGPPAPSTAASQPGGVVTQHSLSGSRSGSRHHLGQESGITTSSLRGGASFSSETGSVVVHEEGTYTK